MTTSGRIRDQYLAFFILLLVGLITITPRIPILWNVLDPWFFLLFDGEWKYVDIFYYSLVTLAFVDLARRSLQPKLWPWPVIIAAVPYVGWGLASCLWSRFPGFSLHEWFYSHLIPLAALLLGFSCFRSGGVGRHQIELLSLVLLLYLVPGYLVLFKEFQAVGFDVVVSSTWLAYAFPFLFWWVAERLDHTEQKWPLLAVGVLFLYQFVAMVFFPQRMYMLTLAFLSVGVAVVYAWNGVTPHKKALWAACCGLLICFFLGSYYSISLARPVSYVTGEMGGGDGYYKVFAHSERYRIFEYWFARGIENIWMGVGLGWQLPAIEYNHRFLDDTALNDTLFSHGHNYLINVWLQTGLVGVLCLLGWVFFVIAYLRIRWANIPKTGRRMALTIMALMVTLFLRNLSDDGMREGNPVFFWLLVGGGLGYVERLRAKKACLGELETLNGQ